MATFDLSGTTLSVPGAYTYTASANSLTAAVGSETVLGTPVVTVSPASIAYGATPTTLTATIAFSQPFAPSGAVIFQVGSGSTVNATSCSGASSPLTCTASYPTGTLAAGQYTITVSSAADTNYTAASNTGTLSVTAATPIVSVWPIASAITYGQTLASSALTGGQASVPGTFIWTSSTTAPQAGTASYAVTFTPTDTADYTTVFGTASVVVNKATPIIASWPAASTITYGQTLASSTLTGGTASVPGSFSWANGATIPAVGTAGYPAVFTPADLADYNTVDVNVSLTVNAPDTLGALRVGGVPLQANPGQAYMVTVSAIGVSGNVLNGFTGTVALTTGDASAAISPGSYTYSAADNGVHTFQVTFNTSGIYALTASTGAVSGAETGIKVGGYIWVVGATGQLERVSEAGASVTSGVGQQNSPGQYGAIAFDASGNTWSVQSASDSLLRTSNTGGQPTTLTGGGLSTPTSLAVDGAGMVWVANSGNGSLSEFNNNGTPLTVNGLLPASGIAPSAVAIDQRGGIWVANRSAGTVKHVLGAGTPVVTPTAAASSTAHLGVAP